MTLAKAPSKSSIVTEQARQSDVQGITALLDHYASLGNVLPRSTLEIEQVLNHFLVARDQHQIVGCGALEYFSSELAEIRSLVIDPQQHGRGLGGKLLSALIKQAQSTKVKRLMALTYAPDFFHKHGFITVDKAVFPEKIWGICINCYKFSNCDEIAVLKQLD